MIGDSEDDNASDTDSPSSTIVVIGDQKPRNITVTSALLDQQGKPVSIVDTETWVHSDNWDTIVCPELLVSRKELLQLLAEKLHTSRNQIGMRKVSKCLRFIGRHVTVTTASMMRLHYWGCGTYNRVEKNGTSKQQTWVEVVGTDTPSSSTRQTSRLAYVACAMYLNNIRETMGAPLPEELREVPDKDGKFNSVTFLLVRYAQAHASAVQRGPEHRPLCPGPLKNTHCLWTWAKRPEGHERGCFRTRPWERHKRHFGSTEDEQSRVMEGDRRAWYDLIQVTNIKNYANIQKDPDPYLDEVFLQSCLWT